MLTKKRRMEMDNIPEDPTPQSASINVNQKMAYVTNRLQKDERWQRLLLGDCLPRSPFKGAAVMND